MKFAVYWNFKTQIPQRITKQKSAFHIKISLTLFYEFYEIPL